MESTQFFVDMIKEHLAYLQTASTDLINLNNSRIETIKAMISEDAEAIGKLGYNIDEDSISAINNEIELTRISITRIASSEFFLKAMLLFDKTMTSSDDIAAWKDEMLKQFSARFDDLADLANGLWMQIDSRNEFIQDLLNKNSLVLLVNDLLRQNLRDQNYLAQINDEKNFLLKVMRSILTKLALPQNNEEDEVDGP